MNLSINHGLKSTLIVEKPQYLVIEVIKMLQTITAVDRLLNKASENDIFI